MGVADDFIENFKFQISKWSNQGVAGDAIVLFQLDRKEQGS